MTVLEAFIQSLNRAGEYNRDDQVAPAVILWPDKERQWEPVLPVLRDRLSHLLTLGPYDPKSKTGHNFTHNVADCARMFNSKRWRYCRQNVNRTRVGFR